MRAIIDDATGNLLRIYTPEPTIDKTWHGFDEKLGMGSKPGAYLSKRGYEVIQNKLKPSYLNFSATLNKLAADGAGEVIAAKEIVAYYTHCKFFPEDNPKAKYQPTWAIFIGGIQEMPIGGGVRSLTAPPGPPITFSPHTEALILINARTGGYEVMLEGAHIIPATGDGRH